MSGPITQAFGQEVARQVGEWPSNLGLRHLEGVFRLLAKWRSTVLAQTYIAHNGARIGSGLFEGMDYVAEVSEGSLCARLFGTYESCLHPHILDFHARGLDCVVDIGCAEGYYAVGLARRFPELTVHARDIDPLALRLCAELARKNGVEDRVLIGGEFKPTDFEAFAGQRALVMVDVEGAELDILRPDLAPALAGMGLIVETHAPHDKILPELWRRFEPTHEIERVDQTPTAYDMPQWLRELSELDQLVAEWEWRHRLTPWLIMRPRA